jgi:hypothetical protein
MRLPYYMLADTQGQDPKGLSLVDINLESYRNDGQGEKWQAIFASAFPDDKEYSLDKPGKPDPQDPDKRKPPKPEKGRLVLKTHDSYFTENFINNPNPLPEAMAAYLYNNCSIPRALTQLFAKWETNTDYTAKREVLRKLLKNKQEKKNKNDDAKRTKSVHQKRAEAALEPWLKQQRFALACFLRRCWNEMSQTGSLYAETDKLGDKLSYVVLYACADADYDGRSARIGIVGPKSKDGGGAVSRAYLWAPKTAQLPVQQVVNIPPTLELRTKARVEKWRIDRKTRPPFGTVIPQPVNPQPVDPQPVGPQPGSPDFTGKKRPCPYDSGDDSDYDDDESVASDLSYREIKKVHASSENVDDSGDGEYAGDDDDANMDDDERLGDLARRGSILAQVGAGFQSDDDDDGSGSVISMDTEKDDVEADDADSDSGMSIMNLNLASQTSSLESVSNAGTITLESISEARILALSSAPALEASPSAADVDIEESTASENTVEASTMTQSPVEIQEPPTTPSSESSSQPVTDGVWRKVSHTSSKVSRFSFHIAPVPSNPIKVFA